MGRNTSTMDDEYVAEWWDSYKSGGCGEARQRLILHYSGLLKFAAMRVAAGAPSIVEVADLIQYGYFGLIDAIDRFEPSRGFKFESYAIWRIRGAIIDELRALDWAPRSVRAGARQHTNAVSRLENTLRRQPTNTELAVEMGVDEDELARMRSRIASARIERLDDLVREGSSDHSPLTPSVVDFPDSASSFENEMHGRLEEAMAKLRARDRRVLELRYIEDKTLAEIGEILGVTESRVCQIHGAAIRQLRARVAPDETIDPAAEGQRAESMRVSA